MDWDDRYELIGFAPKDVLVALAVRPASWLHPFLQLAATRADPAAGRSPDRRSTRHWYRLSLPDPDGSSRFIWHPHGHERLFTSFTGAIVVAPGAQGDGTVLELRGAMVGGIDEVNAAACAAVLGLVAAAMEAAQSEG